MIERDILPCIYIRFWQYFHTCIQRYTAHILRAPLWFSWLYSSLVWVVKSSNSIGLKMQHCCGQVCWGIQKLKVNKAIVPLQQIHSSLIYRMFETNIILRKEKCLYAYFGDHMCLIFFPMNILDFGLRLDLILVRLCYKKFLENNIGSVGNVPSSKTSVV